MVGLLHALGGGEDPVCRDVDVWQTLSIDGLLTHRVSPREVQRLAEVHHCESPPGHLTIHF